MNLKLNLITLCAPDPEAARRLLTGITGAGWTVDGLTASGEVFGNPTRQAYESSSRHIRPDSEPPELEIVEYESGPNFMDLRPNADPYRVASIGARVSSEQLAEARAFFTARGIGVAEELLVEDDDGNRVLHVVFDTHSILGVDIKLIDSGRGRYD
jgi:hypothetical protein